MGYRVVTLVCMKGISAGGYLSFGVVVVCFWIYIGMYGLDDLVLEFVAVVLVGNLVEVFAMIGVV